MHCNQITRVKVLEKLLREDSSTKVKEPQVFYLTIDASSYVLQAPSSSPPRYPSIRRTIFFVSFKADLARINLEEGFNLTHMTHSSNCASTIG
jgi:hypothetical protein